jgi:uncharacterized phage protein gp47/JayE
VSKTPDVIASEILAKLSVTAPGFSLELGTPERKIVDAVAEAVSEAYIDQYLVVSLLDIESKVGLELEQYCSIFGFGRLQGKASTGTVRVELTTTSTLDVPIPSGSQFFTRQSLPGSGNPLFFASTQAVVIPAGTYVVDVPVQCTVVGVAGNLPPDSITYLGAVAGTSKVTNLTPMIGGVDVETDEELRQRFKDTFMRNVAGTEDWYLGLCYQNKNVSKAAVFGPVRKYVTQVAVPETSVSLGVHADVKYTFEMGETVFKNLGQDDEVFYRPGDDYTFTGGSDPTFTRIESGALVPGDVVDVEFEYTTRSSRNNPATGITNKVDVFVNGSDPYTVTERTVITAQTLSSNSTLWNYTGNFARVGTAGSPASSSRFMRLGSVPIVSFPSSIVVGVTNYQLGTHYHLLRGTTLDAGTVREIAGIEWLASGPATSTALTLNYIYNRVPETLGIVMKKSKQITTDVLVHQARYAYLKVYISIEYDRGFVISQVDNGIRDRLRTYFAGMPYGSWIEISDLSLAVHQVLGVDNVILTTNGEAGALGYGIEVYDGATDLAHQERLRR